LQNNHTAPKAPFLSITQQKLPYRTGGTARQPLPAYEQKSLASLLVAFYPSIREESSLLESMAYYARGLNLRKCKVSGII